MLIWWLKGQAFFLIWSTFLITYLEFAQICWDQHALPNVNVSWLFLEIISDFLRLAKIPQSNKGFFNPQRYLIIFTVGWVVSELVTASTRQLTQNMMQWCILRTVVTSKISRESCIWMFFPTHWGGEDRPDSSWRIEPPKKKQFNPRIPATLNELPICHPFFPRLGHHTSRSATLGWKICQMSPSNMDLR